MKKDIQDRRLEFHWRLPLNGEGKILGQQNDRSVMGIPNYEQCLAFCKLAEANGISSLLTAFSSMMPDPIPLITALGMATEKIHFMLAYRPGLLSPTLFVQQVNTISALLKGRLCLNIVVGHSVKEQAFYGDYLSKHERYLRAAEFLSICNSLWRSKEPVNFKGLSIVYEKSLTETANDLFPTELDMADRNDEILAIHIRHHGGIVENPLEFGLNPTLVFKPLAGMAVLHGCGW